MSLLSYGLTRGYVTSSKYDVSDKGEMIKCIFLILLQEKIPKNKAISHITYSWTRRCHVIVGDRIPPSDLADHTRSTCRDHRDSKTTNHKNSRELCSSADQVRPLSTGQWKKDSLWGKKKKGVTRRDSITKTPSHNIKSSHHISHLIYKRYIVLQFKSYHSTIII